MNALVELAQNNKPIAALKGINKLLLGTVIVPTFLAIIYFSLIASDVYISESRFVVRSPERQTASPLGALLKGTGFSSSQDDTYTVQDYILSRDALQLLVDKLSIDKAFSNKNVDIFGRFGSLDFDHSFEALYKYYKKKVEVELDPLSSITTLTVRSFSAEDSLHMNEQLIEISETLVNQLNEAGRKDMIRFAAQEVQDAEKKAKTAALTGQPHIN